MTQAAQANKIGKTLAWILFFACADVALLSTLVFALPEGAARSHNLGLAAASGMKQILFGALGLVLVSFLAWRELKRRWFRAQGLPHRALGLYVKKHFLGFLLAVVLWAIVSGYLHRVDLGLTDYLNKGGSAGRAQYWACLLFLGEFVRNLIWGLPVFLGCRAVLAARQNPDALAAPQRRTPPIKASWIDILFLLIIAPMSWGGAYLIDPYGTEYMMNHDDFGGFSVFLFRLLLLSWAVLLAVILYLYLKYLRREAYKDRLIGAFVFGWLGGIALSFFGAAVLATLLKPWLKDASIYICYGLIIEGPLLLGYKQFLFKLNDK